MKNRTSTVLRVCSLCGLCGKILPQPPPAGDKNVVNLCAVSGLVVNVFSVPFLLTEKNQKVKTAEGNHALRVMTETFAAVQSYGLSEITRLLSFFAAGCRLTQGKFALQWR